MAKKFTKLFLGDVVKTVGSRVFRKLTTEQPVVEDELQGTWVLNDTLDIEDWTEEIYVVNFVSNSTNYGKLWVGFYSDAEVDYVRYSVADASFGQSVEVYEDTSWNNNAYKTINITSKLSEVENGEALLTWLKANATKQTTTQTLITFTIGSTTYQAEDGMTWAEWVNSEYNTGGYHMEGNSIYTNYNSIIYYQPYQAANITVYSSDIILANGKYDTRQSTSGGAGN